MAEIDLWRERNATLSALTEQLKLPLVKKVLKVLEAANSTVHDSFQLVLSELSKHHVEAVDNVRFLSTLERHLKVCFCQRHCFSGGKARSLQVKVKKQNKHEIAGCFLKGCDCCFFFAPYKSMVVNILSVQGEKQLLF